MQWFQNLFHLVDKSLGLSKLETLMTPAQMTAHYWIVGIVGCIATIFLATVIAYVVYCLIYWIRPLLGWLGMKTPTLWKKILGSKKGKKGKQDTKKKPRERAMRGHCRS